MYRVILSITYCSILLGIMACQNNDEQRISEQDISFCEKCKSTNIENWYEFDSLGYKALFPKKPSFKKHFRGRPKDLGGDYEANVVIYSQKTDDTSKLFYSVTSFDLMVDEGVLVDSVEMKRLLTTSMNGGIRQSNGVLLGEPIYGLANASEKWVFYGMRKKDRIVMTKAIQTKDTQYRIQIMYDESYMASVENAVVFLNSLKIK